MAMDNTLSAKYLNRAVVKDRNKITLNQWAAYVATEPLPPAPADDAWVRPRIVAENIPLTLIVTVDQTLGYFLQDPATTDNIAAFISEDNDTATEQDLSAKNQTICGTFMPRYALTTVSQQQIDTWRQKNEGQSAPGGKR